jgi:putative membrane protein
MDMGMGALRMVNETLRNCCSGLKSLLLARASVDPDRKSAGRVRINLDLSDKATFFAWQRNHMANERTFLSWCRTGISLIAFGFVIERFDVLIREMKLIALPVLSEHSSHMPTTRYMAIIALGLGTVIIILAGWRFFYIRRHINSADTHFSVVPDTFLLASVLLTVAAAFVFFAFYF